MAKSSIRSLFSLMQKGILETSAIMFSTSPLSTSCSLSSSSFTVEFLMKSCGLPLESAVLASKKLQIKEENCQKLQSVLKFLKSHGFNDTHIAKLIERRPTILQCKVEDNLKAKFEFFMENGFVGRLLPELIVSNPVILTRSLDHINQAFEILKSFLDSNELIVAAIKHGPVLLMYDLKCTMQPNIDFLMKEGVPLAIIAKTIKLYPRVIIQKHDRMVYAVNAVKKLGLQPKAPMFRHAVMVMLSMSESTLKNKMEVMKSMGWSEEQILSTLRKDPLVLACSEEKMRNAVDFYLHAMKLELEIIIGNPKFLMYSINKRIQPRYNVLKVLESKKLIKWNKNILWPLARSEKCFLEQYVNKHVDKVPGLLEIYRGTNKAKK